MVEWVHRLLLASTGIVCELVLRWGIQQVGEEEDRKGGKVVMMGEWAETERTGAGTEEEEAEAVGAAATTWRHLGER